MRKSDLFLLGKDASDLIEVSPALFLLPKTIQAFQKLHALGQKEGFDLKIVSAYRSYEAQKSIWQAKAQGQRPLLADDGSPLDFSSLSAQEILQAMLRWSAIPGASRHHWGSDFDVIDSQALQQVLKKDPSFKVELTPQEVAPEGVFGPMHLWLDQLIQAQEAFGFFRPYETDRGGVAPEKWHLSFRPLSEGFLNQYTLELFTQMIEQSDLHFKDLLLEDAPEIYQRYLLNICS